MKWTDGIFAGVMMLIAGVIMFHGEAKGADYPLPAVFVVVGGGVVALLSAIKWDLERPTP